MTLRLRLSNHSLLRAGVLLRFTLACVLILSIQPKSAQAAYGNDYPWQSAQLTGHAYAWQMAGDNDIYSPLRFAYRNCTDWAAWRLNVARGGSTQDLRFTWSSLAFSNGDGNARGWRQGALNSGFTVDGQPAVGAVAWWDGSVGGGYGHVAVVSEVHDGGNRIVLEDYNYHGNGNYMARSVSKGSGWPHAFLHIADAAQVVRNRSIGQVSYHGSWRLLPGESLPVGSYLLSEDVRYAFVLQTDGNLVLYGHGGQPQWQSGTTGSNAARLTMQEDGNLVLYTADNHPVWHTEITNYPGSSLEVQTDGNVVTYSQQRQPTWHLHKSSPANFTHRFTARIEPNEILYEGQYLRSIDRRYALLVQGDGNLVLYGPAYHVLWESGTGGHGGVRAQMQGDGNFVVYDAGLVARWSTTTGGLSGAHLQLQDDGNLAVYQNTTPHWATHTAGQH